MYIEKIPVWNQTPFELATIKGVAQSLVVEAPLKSVPAHKVSLVRVSLKLG